jgi:hypothetical protein
MNCKTSACSRCPFPAEYKTFGKLLFEHPVHRHHGSNVVLLKRPNDAADNIVRRLKERQFDRLGHDNMTRVSPAAAAGY